jgi:hypothetical protein
MCILVIKRADGDKISDETLKVMYDNNNDSCGLSYINTDHLGVRRLKVHKYMDFEPFLEKYRRCERISPESNFLLHFRIATSGELSTFNQHPFWVKKGSVMAHNGIIASARKDPDGRRNDTQMFLDDTIKELPEDWMEYSAILDMIEDYIGYSKLAFLNEDGSYLILNEQKGSWNGGSWYSNDSWKKPKYKWTPKKYKSLPAPEYNYASKVPCDYCKKEITMWELSAYDLFSFVEGYCTECEKKLLDTSIIYPAEKVAKARYISYMNGGITGYDNHKHGW